MHCLDNLSTGQCIANIINKYFHSVASFCTKYDETLVDAQFVRVERLWWAFQFSLHIEPVTLKPKITLVVKSTLGDVRCTYSVLCCIAGCCVPKRIDCYNSKQLNQIQAEVVKMFTFVVPTNAALPSSRLRMLFLFNMQMYARIY